MEVMVGLTLGLILVLGLVVLLSNVSNARNEIDKSSRQIENGRYSVQVLVNDAHHAGYYGYSVYRPAIPAALPDPCATTAAALEPSIALPVQGYNAPAIPTISCLNDANHIDGTDIFVIRRAATQMTSLAALTANRAYIQTSPAENPIVNLGSDPAPFTLSARDCNRDGAPTTPELCNPRELDVHVYYVSPCSAVACTATTDSIPTLKRLELGIDPGTGNAAMLVVPLVEGVENMQVEYGIDDTPSTVDPTTGFVGDGSPDRYVTNPANTTEWSNVVSVRFYLLVRNTEFTAGYDDNKIYTLGSGIAGTVIVDNSAADIGGNFKRHVYTSVARVVNNGGQREVP
jgi:type IV pilus assembly protein PilW